MFAQPGIKYETRKVIERCCQAFEATCGKSRESAWEKRKFCWRKFCFFFIVYFSLHSNAVFIGFYCTWSRVSIQTLVGVSTELLLEIWSKSEHCENVRKNHWTLIVRQTNFSPTLATVDVNATATADAGCSGRWRNANSPTRNFSISPIETRMKESRISACSSSSVGGKKKRLKLQTVSETPWAGNMERKRRTFFYWYCNCKCSTPIAPTAAPATARQKLRWTWELSCHRYRRRRCSFFFD